MNNLNSNKPLKHGTDPHRAFQCLETIYISENDASQISVGDKVFWDFENALLRINDKVKVQIEINKGKYYYCIDSYRHKVISWVAAKEGRKIKIFATVDLKHPYGQTLNPTESESIERNIHNIYGGLLCQDKILPYISYAKFILQWNENY